MIKAVIFDLDGTLCNTLADLTAAVNEAISPYSSEKKSEAEVCSMIGDGIPMLLSRALGDAADERQKEKAYKTFKKYYSEHLTDNTYAYDGIEQTLSALKEMKLRLAVLTNKNQAFAEEIVKTLLPRKFDVILGAKPSMPKKPDPTGAFFVARKLKVNTDECVIVGDSANDINTASNCGAVSIGVPWGFRSVDELRANHARFIAAEPSEIAEIIKRING